MKFEIDTTEKTIVIEGQYTFAEIEKELKKMIPDWKEYKLTGKQPEYNGWTIYPSYPSYPVTYWGGINGNPTVTTSAIPLSQQN